MRAFMLTVGMAVIVVSAGCARHSAGTIDAPVGKQDNSPAMIINMPNAWRNVATKCITVMHHKRLFETRSNSNSPSVPVIVDDPACP